MWKLVTSAWTTSICSKYPMKIYFHASIFGKQFLSSSYETIADICKKEKYDVVGDYMLSRNHKATDKFSKKEHRKDFQKLSHELKTADAVIIEATYPSIGAGHYLTLGLQYMKPTLVLSQNNPHGVLVGNPSRLLTLKKYDPSDTAELTKFIKSFLTKAGKEHLNRRFNIMLTEEMDTWLDDTASTQGRKKAELLRDLIHKSMLEK